MWRGCASRSVLLHPFRGTDVTRQDNLMNRTRTNSFTPEKTAARIVWRDGPFRMECMDAGHGMRLTVFSGDSVLAQESVESAEVGWRRSA